MVYLSTRLIIMNRRLLKLPYTAVLLGLLSVSAVGQTVDQIYQSLSLNQKVALLFVSKESSKTTQNLKPLAYITASDDKTIKPDNGLKLIDFSEPNEKQLGIAFPNADVIKACGNQYLVTSLYFSAMQQCSSASGVVAASFPLGINALKLKENHPVPSQLVVFKDVLQSQVLNADNEHIAGIIPLPAMFMKYKDAQGAGNVGKQTSSFNLFKSWKVADEKASPMGFTLEDVLQCPYLFVTNDLAKDVEKLSRAIDNNLIDKSLFEKRVKWAIACQLAVKPLGVSNLKVTENQDVLRRRIYESSLVLARDTLGLLPFKLLNDKDIAFVDARNQKTGNPEAHLKFNHLTSQFVDSKQYIDSLKFKPSKRKVLFFLCDKLEQLPELTLQAYKLKSKSQNIAIGLILCDLIDTKRFVGNDYRVFDMVVLGYANEPIIWESAIDAVYGALPFEGNSIVDLPSLAQKSRQIHYAKKYMKLGTPAEAGMRAETLNRIDSIVNDAIAAHATPGVQVLVARHGIVVYDKAFGFTTYDSLETITTSSLYDIASITKIMATTPMMMHLCDVSKVSIETPLKKYLPETAKTNKADILLSELLIHKAGLQASVPTFYNAIDRNVLSGKLVSKTRSEDYPFQVDEHLFLNKNTRLRFDLFKNVPDSLFSVEVARNLYMNYHFRDSMYLQMLETPVSKVKAYRYSDMGLSFLQHVIERVEDKPLQKLVDSLFYRPMELTGILYRPLKTFDSQCIVPTEREEVFRQQLLRGYVHDPGAAMLGGVAGHAGLFSNAGELAKIMQMYLNGGSYGGRQLIKPETVKLFTCRYNDTTRRGLGFDKPEVQSSKLSPVCADASDESFGHLGFTGCIAWADPKNDLIFIFLSNRVYPHSWNKRLIQADVRANAMQVAYDAIIEP
jgi:CubicO group peptidase (beta-lactamase class C family)